MLERLWGDTPHPRAKEKPWKNVQVLYLFFDWIVWLFYIKLYEFQLHGAGAAMRRYPMSKVRSRSHEETPNTEIQEQWMCFAGLAMRRYPTSKVKETPAR